MGLYFLDYGAGNVQSLANSLKKLGYGFQWVTGADDFHKATVRLPYVPSLAYPLTVMHALESDIPWRRFVRPSHRYPRIQGLFAAAP